MNTRVSVFFHNYYGQHQKWLEFFCARMPVSFNLYYNIVDDSIYNFEEESNIPRETSESIRGCQMGKMNVRLSSNIGKDIGGKLVLADAFLHFADSAEFIVFLHDKQSPHKVHNQEWQQKLIQVIEPQFARKAIDHFDTNPLTGIVATAENIKNELDLSTGSFISNNQDQLARLRKTYGFKNSDHRFVAGTMFWARAKPLLEFFTKYPPLDIRKELEPGNVIDENHGTNTHAWERMLSWIILEKGYQIKGM